MRYLIDTNVLSEARKPHGDPNVKHWLREQQTNNLAISAITVLEIDVGIRLLRRRDPTAAGVFQHWLDHQVLTAFSGRVLPFDLACALRTSPMHVPDPAPEHDAIIAGTALVHDLVVVTRNVDDFARLEVEVINPWAG